MLRLLWALVMVVGVARAADEPTVPRYLELRDGTVLRLPVVDEQWQVTVVRAEGDIDNRTVRLSSLQRLNLTPARAAEKQRAVLAALRKMGAADFAERDQGQAELTRLGPAVRPLLETAVGLSSDIEVQYRIKQVLGKWPVGPAMPTTAGASFDSLTAGPTLWGDAGDAEIAVRLEGAVRRLNRRLVAAISLDAPKAQELGVHSSAPGGFRRIEAIDFPPACLEESFDKTPSGRQLVMGENIEKLFIAKGFILSTSIPTSFVSVNGFNCMGKSKGQSAATHQPLFHGEITIRFVKPGQETVPAGVRYFGCWLGTGGAPPKANALVAYDARGRELGRVQREGRAIGEFMAAHSDVPMYQVRIVPDVKVYPQYTLDDFIYSPPESGAAPHPDKYTVHLAGGERALCGDVTFTREGVRLQGLFAGLPDLTRPEGDVLSVLLPARGRAEGKVSAGVFAELSDGSVVLGVAPEGKRVPVFERPQLLKDPSTVVGLWRADVPRMAWPANATPPSIWDAGQRSWQKIVNVKLKEEEVAWTTADGKQQSSSYGAMPPLLLRSPPPEPKPGSWQVRTVLGEEFILAGEAAGLSGTLSAELSVIWQGKPLKVPARELVSLSRVVKIPDAGRKSGPESKMP